MNLIYVIVVMGEDKMIENIAIKKIRFSKKSMPIFTVNLKKGQ